MILSYLPIGESERKMVEAQIQINHPLPTTVVLEDDSVLDLSTWRIRIFRVIKADRTEIKALSRMGLL